VVEGSRAAECQRKPGEQDDIAGRNILMCIAALGLSAREHLQVRSPAGNYIVPGVKGNYSIPIQPIQTTSQAGL